MVSVGGLLMGPDPLFRQSYCFGNLSTRKTAVASNAILMFSRLRHPHLIGRSAGHLFIWEQLEKSGKRPPKTTWELGPEEACHKV